MKNIFYILGLVVVIAAGGFFLYGDFTPQFALGNPIKIGALISQTGFAASFGEVAKHSMQLAVDEINKNGGIDGRMVELYVEDDATDPKQAVSGFQKLTSVDHVDGVIGGLFDFVAQPLFPLAQSSQAPLVTPTQPYIPGGFDLTDYSFTMLPEFGSIIRELKGYVQTHDTQKLAVVHFSSVFGKKIAATLNDVSQELGKGAIVDEQYTAIGQNDFRTTVLKLKTAGVDTVFLDMVDVDPVTFLTRCRELNYHPTIISYASLPDSFAAPDKDKSLMEGIVILDWEFSDPQFSKNYKARYGQEPTKSADKSYAAVYVLAEAIAKSQSRADVAGYLAAHSFDTPVGKVEFNSKHAVDSTPVRIVQIKNGTLVPLQ